MSSVHIVGPRFSNLVRSVALVCHEKGIPFCAGLDFEGRRYGFKSPELASINPFCRVPVLLHGQRVVYETTTICRYLDAAFDGPPLQPSDVWLRTQVDQWCSALSLYVDDTLMSRYLAEFVFPMGEAGGVRDDKVRESEPEVRRQLGLLTRQLGQRDFLVGDAFSLADAMAAPILDYVLGLPQAATLAAEVPSLVRYTEALRRRPSGRQVLVATDFSED